MSVEDSFRRLLDCGIVERGIARVVCPSCQYEILVPFSCKVRGLCPSCDGRRQAAGGWCGRPGGSHPAGGRRLPAMDVVVAAAVADSLAPRQGAGLGGAARVRARRVRVSSPPRASPRHRGRPDRRGHRDPAGGIVRQCQPACSYTGPGGRLARAARWLAWLSPAATAPRFHGVLSSAPRVAFPRRPIAANRGGRAGEPDRVTTRGPRPKRRGTG